MNPVRWDRALFKAFVSLGAMWTLVTVAEIICFQLDAGVIGYFLPEDPLNISIFGVGMRLPSVAFMSVGVIGGVLMPKFSGLSAKGDHAAVMALLTRANVATVLAAALLLVNLGVLGPQFLELWLHKPWVATSGRIMMMMLPAYFIALLGVPANNLLIGVARLRGLAMLTLGEAAVNFALSVALVKPFGIWGVGLGTALPLALFRGVLFPFLLRRELGIEPREYFGAMKRALLVAVLYLAAVCPLSFVPVPTFTRFVLLGSGSVVVFAAIVLALVPEARVEASRRLARLRRRPAA